MRELTRTDSRQDCAVGQCGNGESPAGPLFWQHSQWIVNCSLADGGMSREVRLRLSWQPAARVKAKKVGPLLARNVLHHWWLPCSWQEHKAAGWGAPYATGFGHSPCCRNLLWLGATGSRPASVLRIAPASTRASNTLRAGAAPSCAAMTVRAILPSERREGSEGGAGGTRRSGSRLQA